MVSRLRQTATVLCVVSAVLVSAVGAAGAGTAGRQTDLGDDFDAPAFIVDVDKDGSATIVVTFAFNLSDDSRQAAFQEIRDNQTIRERFRTQFEERFQSVASDSENATGREMSVSNATLDFRSDSTTGVIEASLTWNGLAAVDGNQVTVSEPLASGFTTERPVHMQIPDGYTVNSVTPTPDSESNGTLTYTTGADFTGFELIVAAPADSTATPTPTETASDGSDGADGDGGVDGDSSDGGDSGGTDGGSDGTDTPAENGPGFGIGAVAGALASLFVLVRMRR